MLADNRIYYELAYYPEQDKDPRKIRRITVSVKNHPEYLVRAQRSYILSELRKSGTGGEGQEATGALQKAISDPLPLTDVGATLFAEFLAHGRDQTEIELQLQIQGDHLRYRWQDPYFLSELELAGIIYQFDGKSVGSLADRLQVKVPSEQLDLARARGFRFVKRIDLPPGLYHVRMAVRDIQSERMGTAFAWVEVPSLTKGKLVLSKISLPEAAAGVDKPPADYRQPEIVEPKEVNGLRLFRQADNLAYACMIYNAPFQSPGDDLRMQLELFKGERRIYLKPWFPVLSSSSAKDKFGMEITGQLGLQSLQPGIFELRVTVRTAKSDQTARRAISFVVAP